MIPQWIGILIALILATFGLTLLSLIGIPYAFEKMMKKQEYQIKPPERTDKEYIEIQTKIIYLLLLGILLMSIAFGTAIYYLDGCEDKANIRIAQCNEQIRNLSQQCYFTPAQQQSMPFAPLQLLNSSVIS